MRIIAGEHRGRRIQAPPGRGTRPMLDRVREACFGTLQGRVPEARVLDLFSGTGSLGLEALSRGASFCRMVEKHGKTAALLKQNVESLELSDRAHVVCGDATAAHHWLDPADGEARRWADLVFMDPPYPWLADPERGQKLVDALDRLTTEVLAEDGIVVLHTPKRSVFTQWLEGSALDHRVYGTSALWYVGAGERE